MVSKTTTATPPPAPIDVNDSVEVPKEEVKVPEKVVVIED